MNTESIQGRIVAWSAAVNAGIINADGRRFTFFKRDWRGETLPSPNMLVVYQPALRAVAPARQKVA